MRAGAQVGDFFPLVQNKQLHMTIRQWKSDKKCLGNPSSSQ